VLVFVTPPHEFIGRILSAAALIISALYYRDVMSAQGRWLHKALVLGGLIFGFYVYTQLCIAEGKRRASRGSAKPDRSNHEP
jgi:hypothetical protein